MKIADLFIAIGIDGGAKVKNTLGETQKGLAETASSALYAKAAILAVLYGLERLVQGSNQAGNQLQNFANYTGLSAEKLQRFAYAGRQFGASAEEIQGSIQGVQKAMSQLETTGQGPAGLWVVGREVGGLDKSKMRDTFYMMEKLQQFAKQTKLPTAIANQALESFGLSPGTIAAMRKNAFNPEAMGNASIYTDKQTQALQRMNAQWGNLSDRWEKMIGRLNAKHGGQLIKDLTEISTGFEKLINSVMRLAEQLKVFTLLSGAVREIAGILGVASDEIDVLTGKRSSKDVVADWRKNYDKLPATIQFAVQAGDALAGRGKPMDPRAAEAALQTAMAANGTGMQMQQTQNFYGPAEPAKVGAAARAGVEKGISDSVRQSQALKRKH